MKPNSHFRHAFSLIEVTLSLAIVAFVLLTIMALMPTGLKMMSDSSQSEVSANIITELRGQFQQAPFTANGAGDASTIYTLANQTLYYDAAGTQLSTAQVTAATNGPMYMATFSVPPASTVTKVNSDSTGIGGGNALPVTVTLAYPVIGTGGPTSITRYTTNVIFVAKQIGL
jgi:uncharacterized protein (TIGR02598 family)